MSGFNSVNQGFLGGGSGGSAPSTVPISGLTAAIATNDIDNANYNQVWRWDALTTGSALTISSNAGSSSTSKYLLNLASSGANIGANRRSIGLFSDITNTGNGFSSNIAGYFNAAGAATNYAIITLAGNVGIGTAQPTSLLQVNGIAQLGTEGSTLGQLLLSGSTSGVISIQSQPAGGTYNFNMPTTAGTAGQVLTSQGGGSAAMTWETLSGITVGTTNIANGTNTRVLYNNSGVVGEYAISGTGNVAMSASPIFTGLPQVNAGTIVYPSTSGYSAFSSASGASTGLNVTNTASNGYIQLNFAETTLLYGGFYKWNSTYGGNYTGTSLPFASSFQIQSGAGNNLPFVVSASALITQIGASGSNKAYRMDGTGLKIGTNADIHTSGTESLDVTGNGLFTGTVNATSGFNGTVGATTRNTGAFTTGSFTGDVTVSSGSRIAIGAQETGVDLAISKAGLGSNLYMWTHSASVPTALLLLNDASTKSMRFQLYPTSYSTSGIEIADTGALFTVGMPFNMGTYNDYNADFWTNNIRRGGISNAGAVDFTGAMRLSNYGAGTATFDASGNITSVSDERLKTGIEPYLSGLYELLLLNPIQYKWDEKSGNETKETYAGFSAQNVKSAIPLGTGENKDGYLSLQERAIVATLVNAVKEQQQIIDELKSNIFKLQQR